MSTEIIVTNIQDLKTLQQKVNSALEKMLEPVKLCNMQQLQEALYDLDDEGQIMFYREWLQLHNDYSPLDEVPS